MIEQGQASMAQHLLHQITTIAPDNEKVWLHLADLTRSQPQKIRYLERMLELNPENQIALQQLHDFDTSDV